MSVRKVTEVTDQQIGDITDGVCRIREGIYILASLKESTSDSYTSAALNFVIDGLVVHIDKIEKILMEELEIGHQPQAQAEQGAEHGGGSE